MDPFGMGKDRGDTRSKGRIRFFWIGLSIFCGVTLRPLMLWVYPEATQQFYYPRTAQLWRIRMRSELALVDVPAHGEAIPFVVVQFRFDRFMQARWSQPLGRGPRWLRQGWCLLLHWRHFTQIADTFCGREGLQEHIVIRGCYTCQFAWWHSRHRHTLEAPPDGTDKHDRMDGVDVEPTGRVQPRL
jgi:hypothetical protein